MVLLATASVAALAAETASPGLVDRATETLRALGVDLGDGEPEFLPPEQAFVLSVHAAGPREIVARWDIAEHYYLYRSRFAFDAADGAIGEPRLPAGETKHDPYFGDVEIYRDSVEVRIPVAEPGRSRALDLELRYQGCADAGLCYPPQTRTVPVRLPSS